MSKFDKTIPAYEAMMAAKQLLGDVYQVGSDSTLNWTFGNIASGIVSNAVPIGRSDLAEKVSVFFVDDMAERSPCVWCGAPMQVSEYAIRHTCERVTVGLEANSWQELSDKISQNLPSGIVGLDPQERTLSTAVFRNELITISTHFPALDHYQQTDMMLFAKRMCGSYEQWMETIPNSRFALNIHIKTIDLDMYEVEEEIPYISPSVRYTINRQQRLSIMSPLFSNMCDSFIFNNKLNLHSAFDWLV